MNASRRIRLLSVCLLTVVGSAVAQTPPTSGLKLWLKADAITGLNNGDKVASWPDWWNLFDPSGKFNQKTQ